MTKEIGTKEPCEPIDAQLLKLMRGSVEAARAFAATYSKQQKYAGIREIPLVTFDFVEGNAVVDAFEDCAYPQRILKEVLVENQICQEEGIGGTYHYGTDPHRYITITTFPSTSNPQLDFKQIQHIEDVGNKEDSLRIILREEWPVIGTQNFGSEPLTAMLQRSLASYRRNWNNVASNNQFSYQ